MVRKPQIHLGVSGLTAFLNQVYLYLSDRLAWENPYIWQGIPKGGFGSGPNNIPLFYQNKKFRKCQNIR